MSDQHKFRYLLPPGTNFGFVAKFRTWFVLSCLLMALSLGALFYNKTVRGEYMMTPSPAFSRRTAACCP